MRAKALLAVGEGKSFARAARECGQSSGDTVAKWVIRFNIEGIYAVAPRHGGGPTLRYGPEEKQQIWGFARQLLDSHSRENSLPSLRLLRQKLQHHGLPTPSTYTLWRILREADFEWPLGKPRLQDQDSALRSKPRDITNNS
ncbi:helix-turn-helix domain-containing protein [bacterium]|nr:MAG: helix-turn-helix domain-containing protein [bacterium]